MMASPSRTWKTPFHGGVAESSASQILRRLDSLTRAERAALAGCSSRVLNLGRDVGQGGRSATRSASMSRAASRGRDRRGDDEHPPEQAARVSQKDGGLDLGLKRTAAVGAPLMREGDIDVDGGG